VQGEARQKRQDTLQEKRYGIDDERYAETTQRQDRLDQRQTTLDGQAVERDTRNHEWDKEKFTAQQDLAKQQHAERIAELNRAYTQRANIADAKAQRAGQKQTQAIYTQLNSDLGAAASGERPLENLVAKINSGADYKSYTASLFGMEQPPSQYENVKLHATGDGKVLVVAYDKDGKPAPWDPDGDGQAGYSMDGNQLVNRFANAAGMDTQAGVNESVATLQNAAGQQAAVVGQQRQSDQEDILVKAADAEQRKSDSEAELATLQSTPLMVTRTDYTGKETTRYNPELQKLVPGGPDAVKARVAQLQSTLGGANDYLAGTLNRQDSVDRGAEQQLGQKLQTLSDATQGLKPADQADNVGNASRSMLNGIEPSVAVAGELPSDALVSAGQKADGQMARLRTMVGNAKPQLKKGEVSPVNEAKLVSSMASAFQANGELEKWSSTVNGQAAMEHIAGELYSRGLDFGAGFLAKVAMGNPKGGQIDAGLAALQNKVVEAVEDPNDREQIALLAAEKYGSGRGQSMDAEAALGMAMKEYMGGPTPTLGDAR
jgi:hypothetical protein